MPGYTHLQHAIPVRLSEHLNAYAQMLLRDKKRLSNAAGNITLTMGSGALAGTMIPAAQYNGKIDGKTVTAPNNSLDTVSDRDFVVEILSALAITGMHLSRLAEDAILWASQEFNFIDIDESFCTGSSLMPQKKNPDILELVRGYTGRLYGNLNNVLVMLKGLPLSYNRDMQHDKEPLFDSFEIIQKELSILTKLFQNVKFKKKKIEKQLQDESLYATDIADYLVKSGVAFKDAHVIVGKLVGYKIKKDIDILQMDAKTLKGFHASLTPKAVKQIINPIASVISKKSIKGTKI